MKVEIWSDIMCPFCYIGKRHFEQALERFEARDQVQVIWKSFQLNPHLITDPGKNPTRHLAETKGWTPEYAQKMQDHVTQMAAQAGLEYHMDKTVVANSFDAHRLIQMAKAHGKGDAAEEALFKAYFTNGKNTGDHTVLAKLGADTGLDIEAVKNMLNSDQYTAEVQNDISEARQFGIGGVPFFVFDRKYAVSGAQPSEVFLNALNTAFTEWKQQHPLTQMNGDNGPSCAPDGTCD